MKRILFLLSIVLSYSLMAQEGSVGIGTQTPNEKAVLHLVAPNNDQGFLVPKLTTSQRDNFSTQLTSSENGMMVYDSDLNQFYFWLTDHWEAVGSSLQAGNGIEIVNGVITNTGDTDPSDDFSGDWADLSNVPADFQDGTDNVDDADNDPNNEIELPGTAISGQVLKYDGTSWVAADESPDGDSDANNELQDLSLSGDILTITGLGTPTQIDLSGYIGTNTDEQDLQFIAGQITLSGDPDNTIIDLSNYDQDVTDDFSGDWADLQNVPAEFADGTDAVDDADNDPTNEIELPASATPGQVLKFDGTNWVADNDLSDDGDSDPTNEIELPTTATTNDVLVFDGTNWVAGPDQVDDPDNDPTNEIELPASANLGDVLKFNDALQWAPAIDQVNDADSDPGNELQDLILSGNILTITGLVSPTEINLAPFAGTNTDEQDLRFTAGQITLTGDPDNTIIDLSNYDADVTDDFSGSFNDLLDVPFYLDTDVTDDFSGSFLDLLDVPENLDVDATDDFDGDWNSLANRPAGLDDGDDVDDADADPGNEFQDLTLGTGRIELTNSTSFIDISGWDTNASDDFTGEDETDPTVDPSVKDGVVWSEVGNIPADLLDGDNVDDADADPGNEFQDLALGTGRIELTNSTSFIDISGWDTNASDDFTGEDETDPTVPANIKDGIVWTEVGGIPADLLDGDDVNDADADPGNEFQDLTLGTGRIELTNSTSFIDISGWDTNASDDFTGEDETDPTVPANIKDGIVWTEVGDIPADILDGDDVNDADASTTNEIQDLAFNAETNVLSITDNASATNIDLSNFFDNTDALADLTASASEGQIPKLSRGVWVASTDENSDLLASIPVSAEDEGRVLKYFPADGGWQPSTDFVNDFQNISLNGTRIELTNSTSFVDISGWDTNASDDFNGSWNNLNDIPADFQDGTDDVNDADASTSNEIQTLSRTGNTLSLSRSGGDVTLMDHYAFKAGKTVDQAFAGDGTTVIVFRTVDYDINRDYDGSSVFTAPADGLYTFSGLITIIMDGGVDAEIYVLVEGNPVYAIVATSAQTSLTSAIQTDLNLASGERVQIGIGGRGRSGIIVGKAVQTQWNGRIEMNFSTR